MLPKPFGVGVGCGEEGGGMGWVRRGGGEGRVGQEEVGKGRASRLRDTLEATAQEELPFHSV